MKLSNIFNILNHNTTKKEQAQLTIWQKEQLENIQVLSKLSDEKLNETISELKSYKQYNVDQAYTMITNKNLNDNSFRIIPLLKYATAACLFLIAGYFIFKPASSTTFTTQIYSTTTQKSNFTLDDNSKVNLDVNSTLTVSDIRNVELKGRAYFEISKTNDGKNFTINTLNGKVTVLGTKFSVWSSGDLLEVAVFEGKVKVQNNNDQIILTAGQVVRSIAGQIKQKIDETENQFSWQTNKLVFKNTPIYKAVDDIGRHFGVKISFQNGLSSNCKISTSFTNESIDEVFLELKTLFYLTYIKSEEQYVITSIRC